MKPFYRDVLVSEEGRSILAEAGILDNGRRLSHFLGQCAAETGGFTVVRESLTYTTVERIRQVWPARAGKATQAELYALVRSPVKLGDWAYGGGRMGNGKGTPEKPCRDGYDFRGGGFLQTTGRAAVEGYCARCGIEMRPDILDDPLATLRFACMEWTAQGCNAFADTDDILRISKAINVGNPNSTVKPNGMDERRAWTAKAKAIWGERTPQTLNTVQQDQPIIKVPAETLNTVAESSAAPMAPAEPAAAPAPAGQETGQEAAPMVAVSPIAPDNGTQNDPDKKPDVPVIKKNLITELHPESGNGCNATAGPSSADKARAVLRTVVQSKSLLTLLIAGAFDAVHAATSWLDDLWDLAAWTVGVLPDLVSDVRTTLTSSEEAAHWFHVPWDKVAVGVTAAAFLVAFLRHLADKRELEAHRAAKEASGS
jgi:putative chitinase